MMNDLIQRWTDFWFTPSPALQLCFIRRGLCVIVAIYFGAALGDVETWYAHGAPASSSNLATFFRTAELTDDARWMISPLFLWDSLLDGTSLSESGLVYRGYLLAGMALAIVVAFADRLSRQNLPGWISGLLESCLPTVFIWVWLVGWANRVVLQAGIAEPVLSVSLAALAIAPIGDVTTWRATLAYRLLSIQATLIAVMTTATMLSSPTWWNGTGAYALVAPAEDRMFSVQQTVFETPIVYELMTLLIVCALPTGIVLAWRQHTRRLGIGLMVAWCVLVGLLSANVLYTATLAIIASSIGWGHRNHTPAGADGANTLNGGSAETIGLTH